MPMQQFSESLPMLLYGALDSVMPRFRKIFKEFGLTEPQWRVLRVLWEHEEIPFREVAVLTRIPAPSLVGVVDRLNSAGFVDRRRSDEDRRVVFLLATKRARELEKQVVPIVLETYAEMRESIRPEVWDRLIAALIEVSSLEPPESANNKEDSE